MASPSSGSEAGSQKSVQRHGGCHCGAVRYDISGPSYYNLLCHCAGCKRITGTSFLSSAVYLKSDFAITSGETSLKTYTITETDSGVPMHRRFCTECGSPLFSSNDANESLIALFPGGLDDAGMADFAPGVEIYCYNRQAWLPQVDGTKRFIRSHKSEEC